MSAPRPVLVACALLAACAACAKAPEPKAPVFELSSVVESRLAALPKPPAAPAIEPALLERLRGQISDRAHLTGKLRALALQDLQTTPEASVAAADALLSDAHSSEEARRSAFEVLGALATPAALSALARRVDIQTTHEPWMRALAAYEASRSDSDVAVPELCAQLKYETDEETVIWIAAYLARQCNFSGLDGLRVISANGRTPELRERALGVLADVAREAGFADADALYAAWNGPDVEHKVPRKEPSPELRAELWRRVCELGVFDLKHVDDARFVLSRSPWWAVELLVEALHERAPLLRAAVVQSLERMGPRASAACPELVRALDESRTAPAVATALAAIGCPDALEPLVRCTQPGHDAELRSSAARALAVLGGQPALDALVALFEKGDSPDLRQTAAEALVELGEGARGAGLLVECLTRPGADHDTAEKALGRWLEREARAGRPGAQARLEAWRALAGEANTTPSVAQSAERHRARAALFAKEK